MAFAQDVQQFAKSILCMRFTYIHAYVYIYLYMYVHLYAVIVVPLTHRHDTFLRFFICFFVGEARACHRSNNN